MATDIHDARWLAPVDIALGLGLPDDTQVLDALAALGLTESRAHSKSREALAIRPGPADLDYRIISSGDLKVAGDRCRIEPASILIDNIVTTKEASRLVGLAFDEPKDNGQNQIEATRLGRAIEDGIGDEPGDGYGTIAVRLNLGQLRRLAARLQ
jgi:hypothetical protein